MTCVVCGKRAYSNYCARHKPRKPITKQGKRYREYEQWKRTIAIPFLDESFGHVCDWEGCGATENLDVDHIKTRGSRPDLKMNLTNIRYLCRYHHRLVTDGYKEVE